MPQFLRANSALAGNLSELEGVPIALTVLDGGEEIDVKVNIDEPDAPKTAAALRVQVTNVETGENLGIRLVFWAGVKMTINSALSSGVNTVVGIPTLGAHPSTEGYDLWTLEDAVEVTDAQIAAALAA